MKTRNRDASAFWQALLLCSLPVVISVTVGKWWVQHADAVKDANPFSGFLKSSEMTSWNWGTLDQRFSPVVWNEVWSNVRQFVLSEPAAVVLLTCCAHWWHHTPGFFGNLRWAGHSPSSWARFCFANLYYRHDYYYSANALLFSFQPACCSPACGNRQLCRE